MYVTALASDGQNSSQFLGLLYWHRVQSPGRQGTWLPQPRFARKRVSQSHRCAIQAQKHCRSGATTESTPLEWCPIEPGGKVIPQTPGQ